MQTHFLLSKFSRSAIWALVATLGMAFPLDLNASVSPSTQPVSVAEQARLHRGEQVRAILLDALEQSCRDNGKWPDRLARTEVGGLKLIYTKPTKDMIARDGAKSECTATVVLHESMEDNPGGVWVGYADGHLEFAATPQNLMDCMNQLRIVAEQPAEPTRQPAPMSGQLTLRIRDADGHPVSGAQVGTYIGVGQSGPQSSLPVFVDGKPNAVSDKRGEVSISATTAFYLKFSEQQSVPVYVLHGQRRLMAQLELGRSDFDGKHMIREVHLSPACMVHGRLTSVGLMVAARNLSWTNVLLFKPGQLARYTIVCESKVGTFDFLLPPGDWGVEAYGTDCDSVFRYFHVEPGQGELDLQLDLPPSRVSQLIGHPAPELQSIKGWKNGGPVRLADLHGHVVLLDFWGYWCGPCVASMPALMKLYDQFKDKGLVVIAVHDDSVNSIADMEHRLESVRQKYWGGRDLPFLVALDGGGSTRIKYSSFTAKGATTAAYGISSFPTTLAIGRDGKVIGQVSVLSPSGLLKIEGLLDPKGPTKD
jgi:thiol-disulfide isomerase/thioredoxin